MQVHACRWQTVLAAIVTMEMLLMSERLYAYTAILASVQSDGSGDFNFMKIRCHLMEVFFFMVLFLYAHNGNGKLL